ncbi:MAG TPA: hypothetical protein VFY93_00770 [Planctomycetota bacterium]|nr:hypothetical protein [Planctomycetota bacterium]
MSQVRAALRKPVADATSDSPPSVSGASRATWRAVLAEAIGPARHVVDLEGATGEWRHLLEQNGCFLLEPTHALRGPVHGALIARHLLSRAREPERLPAVWLDLLEPGGRIILLESTHRGLFRKRRGLFAPKRPTDPLAPYRRGLAPADAALLLEASGYVGIRAFALPVPASASAHYLMSARKR